MEHVHRAALPSANHPQLGREFSVTWQTVRKRLQRYQAEGDAGESCAAAR
jgi:hypothetical protein